MSETITGTVQGISPFNGVSKRTGKPFTIWTVTVDGRDIKAGFKKPTYEIGQNVSIPVEVNKWGDTEMIQPGKPMSGGGGSSAPPKPSAGAAPSGGRTFPVQINSPEMSIIRQNALTNANAAVHNYMERNASEVTEPSTVDEYVEMVIHAAYKFTEFSSGQREAKAVAEMSK